MTRQSGQISIKVILSIAVAFLLAMTSLVFAGSAAVEKRVKIVIGGTGAALGGMRLLSNAFAKHHPGVHFVVLPSLGSSGGIKALAAGKIDLAVSSRPLKEKESHEPIQAMKYAHTPLVFATRHDNPAESISLKELAPIYAGKTLKWPSGDRLRLILRPAKETDIKLLCQLSPAVDEAVQSALTRRTEHIAFNDQDNASALEKIRGSLGLIALGQILTEQRRIKPLAFNDTPVTMEAIRSGRYPLSKSFFLIAGMELRPTVKAFIDFIRSSEGEAILTGTGHLATSPGKNRKHKFND